MMIIGDYIHSYNSMLKLLFRSRLLLSTQQRYRLEDYSRQDYATMCGLLREKYFLNNE